MKQRKKMPQLRHETKKRKATEPVVRPYAKPQPFKAHDVRRGLCADCHRSGTDLKISCPGYRTAADCMDWSKPLPGPEGKRGKDPLGVHRFAGKTQRKEIAKKGARA